MAKLNILVLGYYGKLNAGDDLLMQAMSYLFKEHNLMFSSWFPGISLLNNCDLIVVGGGSIWPGNTFFELGDHLIKRLKTPYMVIGVSTKNANDTVLKNNQKLIKQASFFHVRDQDSKQILGGDDKIYSGVDLFWMLPFEINRMLSEDNFSIGFNIRLWNNTIADYYDITKLIKTHGKLLPFPMYFGSQVHEASATLSDVELLKALGVSDVPAAFCLNALQHCHVMVSMRFHGVLMAVRAGIPTIGFNYHQKIKSFFDENGLSEFCISLDDQDGLNRLLQQIKHNYTAVAAQFSYVSSALQSRALQDKDEIAMQLSKISSRKLSLMYTLQRRLINILS